jgi:hypothetical protein
MVSLKREPYREPSYFPLGRTNHLEARIPADHPLRAIRELAHVAEKAFRLLIFTAHRFPQPKGIGHMHGITPQSPRKTTFSAAC